MEPPQSEALPCRRLSWSGATRDIGLPCGCIHFAPFGPPEIDARYTLTTSTLLRPQRLRESISNPHAHVTEYFGWPNSRCTGTALAGDPAASGRSTLTCCRQTGHVRRDRPSRALHLRRVIRPGGYSSGGSDRSRARKQAISRWVSETLPSAQTGANEISIHARDHFELDFFRAHGFAFADVGATAEEFLFGLRHRS